MRYMFLIYSKEAAEGLSPEEYESLQNAHRAVMEESIRLGVLRSVDKLHPSDTSTTLRMQNGKAITLDGPFAETKEQLAGYYIIECKNLDDAIEWAKKIPSACNGAIGGIEIRPVMDLPQID